MVKMMNGLVFLSAFLTLTAGCFLYDCPTSGKREQEMKQCMKCNDGKGQCIGPKICCGYEFGCLISTKESQICATEDDDTTPCLVQGRRCASVEGGQCVADQMCCNYVSCKFDTKCRRLSDDVSPEFFDLLKKIIQRAKDTDEGGNPKK